MEHCSSWFWLLLNGKYAKGIILISLEFLVNVQANFNEVRQKRMVFMFSHHRMKDLSGLILL